MTIIDRYKSLPEAKAIPDCVWTVQRLVNEADKKRQDLEALEADLETAISLMAGVLRDDWTHEELKTAGLLPGFI